MTKDCLASTKVKMSWKSVSKLERYLHTHHKLNQFNFFMRDTHKYRKNYFLYICPYTQNLHWVILNYIYDKYPEEPVLSELMSQCNTL